MRFVLDSSVGFKTLVAETGRSRSAALRNTLRQAVERLRVL